MRPREDWQHLQIRLSVLLYFPLLFAFPREQPLLSFEVLADFERRLATVALKQVFVEVGWESIQVYLHSLVVLMVGLPSSPFSDTD